MKPIVGALILATLFGASPSVNGASEDTSGFESASKKAGFEVFKSILNNKLPTDFTIHASIQDHETEAGSELIRKMNESRSGEARVTYDESFYCIHKTGDAFSCRSSKDSSIFDHGGLEGSQSGFGRGKGGSWEASSADRVPKQFTYSNGARRREGELLDIANHILKFGIEAVPGSFGWEGNTFVAKYEDGTPMKGTLEIKSGSINRAQYKTGKIREIIDYDYTGQSSLPGIPDKYRVRRFGPDSRLYSSWTVKHFKIELGDATGSVVGAKQVLDRSSGRVLELKETANGTRIPVGQSGRRSVQWFGMMPLLAALLLSGLWVFCKMSRGK